MCFVSKTLLVVLVGMICINTSPAQILNQGQVIAFTQGSVMATGDITNQGEIDNQGEIYSTGNWKNTGIFKERTGEVHFIGASEQKIQHKGQSFYKLLTTGGTKMLEDSLKVINQMVFIDAIFRVQPGSLLLMRKTASINGASMNAYIDGRLYWEGTHPRFYPVGMNELYAPLWLSEEPQSGMEPIVGINLYQPATDGLFDSSLNKISGVRYWERTVLQGKSENAYATLSILEDENIPEIDSAVVAGTSDLTIPFYNLGQQEIMGNVYNGTVKSYEYANKRWLAVGLNASNRSGLVYMPNAFAPSSPNEEERVCKVYGVNLAREGMTLTIYNRWGNVVFQSQSFEHITKFGWNGMNQNTHTEETGGTYTYTLQGRFVTGKEFQRQGTITLIR
ncbi:gliding motility-associated C-terminal domain-containing protein [Cytophagaceae bacterium DM2B3-1]|uniref:Gliding motility-associated C-terminal domain-containing protein n=1 Tax=Xanthocytophaga flava TaxID=3048013 RepID=A0ABT7CK19_9BACT|nr:gliding motility-associated C-terminal domain-containing protein [Xanthocytophaga flavus]MDJ1493372.1 gliding motility-associated C-terminal domain-containing protein [Xanthocytophaga flavus]